MSLITINDTQLSVTLDSCGAVLHSIVCGGAEYLWQGDAKYWKRRDANLFPYVGRLTDGVYLYKGERYPLTIHGFCIGTQFEVAAQSESAVSFVLRANEMTRAQYPFEFEFYVDYALRGNSIVKTCRVVSLDSRTMHFGIGGHPGFNVPIAGEGGFSDWVLEFDVPCEPLRVELDQDNYRYAGTQSAFPLEDGVRIPLRHELFDADAVVLSGTPRAVTLRSPCSQRSVRVEYPDMPFVGFWHMPGTDAGYVCIEPWVSLPSHSAYVEDIEKQEHLVALGAGDEYVNTMVISIC